MGKKIWQKFQELGIAKKLLTLSLSVSLSSIFLMIMINYQLSAKVVQKQTGELLQAKMEQTGINIENFYKGNERILEGIYTDEFYAKKLQPINRWDSAERYQAAHEIEEKLMNICSNNEGILGIAIVGLHYDVCFYDTITQSGKSSVCFDIEEIRKKRILNQTEKNRGIIYLSSQKKTKGEYGDYNCIYVIHQLTDFSEYQKGPIGCAIVCVDEAELRKVYELGNTESNTTLIADNKGNLISVPMENWKPEKILEKEWVNKEEIEEATLTYVRKNQLLKGRNLQVNTMEILNGQYYVINIQNFDYAIRDFKYITVIIIFLGILMAVLCSILVVRTSESVNRSVLPILTAMDKADRNEEEGWIDESKIQGDEFVRISRHFNKMIKNITESRKMEREALIREKNAEIKALEAQINPHFLYNTLDAINWLAIEKNEYTISKMLTGLASILRYSIHKSNEIVKLESELVYLKKYIYLQQQRLNFSFLCTIDVDPSLYSVKIHKMLIQPLIENTLIHGFPGKEDMDEINISIQQVEEDRIEIQVRDNGVGMKSDMVELFNHYDYTKDKIESSIGLRNIIARLNLYYGKEGSFFAESDENGTKITIRIPINGRKIHEDCISGR